MVNTIHSYAFTYMSTHSLFGLLKITDGIVYGRPIAHYSETDVHQYVQQNLFINYGHLEISHKYPDYQGILFPGHFHMIKKNLDYADSQCVQINRFSI